jgi:hypothetical protein
LKNQSDAVNERSTRRSRLRTEIGRRRSPRPRRKAAQKPSQIHGSLIFRPNAPSYPRAMFQATCGPVHASSTVCVESVTFTSAISPASPVVQTSTVQRPVFVSYLASVVRLLGG